MKNILVVFGGRSSENEISIITGVMTANLLDGKLYRAIPLYITQTGEAYTSHEMRHTEFFNGLVVKKQAQRAIITDGGLRLIKRNKLQSKIEVYCAINCCHGEGGEDGEVAAVLNANNVPSASPDVMASALFMDKCATKLIAAALGINQLRYLRISGEEYSRRTKSVLDYVAKRLKFPIIVKPARCGSSIGVSKAEGISELALAVEQALSFDVTCIAERYLPHKREINCACYGSGGDIVVSDCAEVDSADEIYNFAEKYFKSESKREFVKAALSADEERKIKEAMRLLYKKTELKGIVRGDFLISDGKVYFNELNTVPGTLAWYFFADSPSDFKPILSELIDEGVRLHAQKSQRLLLGGYGVLEECKKLK